MPDTHTDERRHSDATAHERIDVLITRLDAVERWMEGFKLQMTEVGAEVKANTRLTEEIHGSIGELVDAIGDLKALGRWGKRFAIGAKYGTYIVGLFAAAWAFFTHK